MTINERVSDERIANLIEVLSFYSPEDKHLANNESELASALRELQQYRAAAEKPVACIDRANLDYFDSGAGADVWPASESDSDDVLLYAAPQLPQPAPVAVPDEMEMDDDFDSAFEHGKAVGWNACRAAMLQGKSERVDEIAEQAGADPRWVDAYQQGYNDSEARKPAIPDGWKLVPVVAFPSQWAAGQKAFESAGINKVDDIYKAMVAAAPQQEAE